MTINQFECNPSVADVILAWGPFLEGPGNFSSLVAPDNFRRNFPVNVREHTIASVKLPEGNFFANKNKMAAGGGLFCPVPRPRTYQVRTVLFTFLCLVYFAGTAEGEGLVGL